jgi:hypothetical protein
MLTKATYITYATPSMFNLFPLLHFPHFLHMPQGSRLLPCVFVSLFMDCQLTTCTQYAHNMHSCIHIVVFLQACDLARELENERSEAWAKAGKGVCIRMCVCHSTLQFRLVCFVYVLFYTLSLSAFLLFCSFAVFFAVDHEGRFKVQMNEMKKRINEQVKSYFSRRTNEQTFIYIYITFVLCISISSSFHLL